LCAEVESRLTSGSAPGADDVRASRTCELSRHRTDYAGRTMHEHALPRKKAAMLEQALPRGQARHHEGRTNGEVNVARQRCEVACLDGYILRQRAVAIPVREAEYPLSNRQPRRAIAESGDHSGQFVSRDGRRPVTADAIGPGRGPRQLIPGESRRMNLNNDVVYRRLRLGPLHQLHSGRSSSLIGRHNRLHRSPPCVGLLHVRYCATPRSLVALTDGASPAQVVHTPHLPQGPPGPGPAVTFARSGITVAWDPKFASLLELA